MEHSQALPTRAELIAEFAKAEIELGNAIYMHRAAWVKARERRDELTDEIKAKYPQADERELSIKASPLVENDPRYVRRLGDVRFWREERACLAATVTALAASVATRPSGMIPRADTSIPWKVPRQGR